MSSLRLSTSALINEAGRFSLPSASRSSRLPAFGEPHRLGVASERVAGELSRAGDALARDADRLSRGLLLAVDGFAGVDAGLAAAVAG